MANKKILVAGDVGVDKYTIGLVERISPEAPVPIVLVDEEKRKLGLAANVADNVRALGGIPLLTGIVGKDVAAADFRGLLESAGISSRHLVVDPSRRTVFKERIVSERQQLLRVDYESQFPVSRQVERQILARARLLLRHGDAVILEDYAKGTLSGEVASGLFKLAKNAGKFVAVDPNGKTPVERYRGAFVLTPNTKEAERLSGIAIVDERSLRDAGELLLAATEARHIVITRGKDGMAIFTADRDGALMIPTFAREVYDVSGAGDTVIATLTLALAAGATIGEAAILGNLAAGVEVGKRGTATVTPAEVLHAMDAFGGG